MEKIAGEAVLLPGEHAHMLATRPEMQIARDWMVVPAARNLHWRYEVLHSAFLVCKQKVAPGESLTHSLQELINATKLNWQRIASNTVVINKVKKPINGNMGMLFSADNITPTEKIILRFYLNTTFKTCRLSSYSKTNRPLLFWISCGPWGSYFRDSVS